MALKSMLDTKEGWQAEKRPGRGVYHFIRETFALCRGLGFYTGDLVPDVPSAPRGNDDCARCYRLLRKEQKRATPSITTPGGGEP